MLRRSSRVPCWLTLFLTFACTVFSQTAPARERFQNSDVNYGWAQDSAGHKLRMFVTRPRNATGKVPVIFFVGWLSCDSVEYPRGGTDGFGAIFWSLIEQSGYATVRMDKPGVGESQGDCAHTDFNTEMSGYQSTFDEMLKYDFIDSARVVVVGLSNGGGTSPLIPRQHPVRGYIAASSWGRTWYEHMLELERVRLSASDENPGTVNSDLKAFIDFYSLYLIHGMKPGEVVTQHPEWKGLWYDAPDGQYGRPAAFYQQLQALNLGDAWQKVTVPVLVIRGTSDSIMSDVDARSIASNVNKSHPGMARYVEVPGGDHLLSVHGKLVDDVVPTMMTWMREQLRNDSGPK
ncbi:MAG TPA: alpha/beta hydrolase [Terriglobales bacterium]|nr:alpha/beta hydrolase [Terriglobales bacterium]